MRFITWLLVPVIAAAVAGPVLATDILNTDAIQAAVVGKTLVGVYPDAETWSETYLVDGELVYMEHSAKVSGAWRVIDGRLCTLYRGDDVESGCFLVVRRSANCFDFYGVEARDGAPLASQKDIEAGLDWSARAWRADRPTTCELGDVI